VSKKSDIAWSKPEARPVRDVAARIDALVARGEKLMTDAETVVGWIKAKLPKEQ